MAKFGTGKFGVDDFGVSDETPVTPPVPTPGVPPAWIVGESRIAWRFFDGTVSYVLPVNPSTASMPTKNKTITYQATCAGKQIAYEGRSEPGRISFSGVILEEAQLRAFENWFNKRKQIQITDDLGQKFWVYLKSFSPTRRKNNDYDWLIDYSAEGTVLDRG